MSPTSTQAKRPAAELPIPAELERAIGELISHYPQKRSAAMMVLHAWQDHFGFISAAAMQWIADKLDLAPINILELVTFYPMFRQEPLGRFQLKICRTLSCALQGSHSLREHLCTKLGLNAAESGPQTTSDGRFTVEFVECLANCAAAPVLLCNEEILEQATPAKVDALVARWSP
jgi:NADH-quinone oxidoreductase subunit E